MVTCSDMIDDVRAYSDLLDPSRPTDAVIVKRLNKGLAELHELLVGQFEHYFTTYTDLNLTGSVYQLSSSVYKVESVQQECNTDSWKEISRIEIRDIPNTNKISLSDTSNNVSGYVLTSDKLMFFPSSSAPGNVRLWYSPTAQQLVSGSSEQLSQQYTQHNWHDYATLSAVVWCLGFDERDTGFFDNQKELIRNRISEAAAQRDLTPTLPVQTRPIAGWSSDIDTLTLR